MRLHFFIWGLCTSLLGDTKLVRAYTVSVLTLIGALRIWLTTTSSGLAVIASAEMRWFAANEGIICLFSFLARWSVLS
jgi:hypothetical protein